MPRDQAASVRLSLKPRGRCMGETPKDSIDYSATEACCCCLHFKFFMEIFKYTNTFIVIKCKCSYTNFLKVFKYLIKCISPMQCLAGEETNYGIVIYPVEHCQITCLLSIMTLYNFCLNSCDLTIRQNYIKLICFIDQIKPHM